MYTYQVVNSGRLWRVVDRSKGCKVLAFRQSYLEAFELAENLEFSRRLTIEMLKEERVA